MWFSIIKKQLHVDSQESAKVPSVHQIKHMTPPKPVAFYPENAVVFSSAGHKNFNSEASLISSV